MHSSKPGSRKNDSASISNSNNSSQDVHQKIVQGKVVYDANMVILEESKDASVVSALDPKN